jgi:hypothetical protein
MCIPCVDDAYSGGRVKVEMKKRWICLVLDTVYRTSRYSHTTVKIADSVDE